LGRGFALNEKRTLPDRQEGKDKAVAGGSWREAKAREREGSVIESRE
jgi:hypothetical protein